MINLEKHLWPLANIDEALAELARRYGLAAKPVEMHALPADWVDDRPKFSRWLETIAQTMTGTRMMRPSVMIFGILNSVASRLPALNPAPGGFCRFLST